MINEQIQRGGDAAKVADCCAQRPSAISVLRERANNLRQQALQAHEEATRLDHLANVMAGISGPAEEALHRLAVDALYRNRIG